MWLTERPQIRHLPIITSSNLLWRKKQRSTFDKAKKTRDLTLKPKASTQYHFNNQEPFLPTTPAVRMVAPAPEDGSGEGEATPLPSEESDSGELYEAMQDDTTVSKGNVEIAVSGTGI